MIFVDGVDIGDVSDVALRDRRMLSADGIFIIVATVSEQDGSSVVPPEVLARGVPFLEGNSAFIDELREAVEDSLDRAAEQQITEIDVLESFLHDDLATFIYERLKRRPMVLAGRRRGLTARRSWPGRSTSATTTSTRIPAPATANAVRGEPSATISAAEQEADARHRGAERLQQAGHARLVLGRRGLLQRGHHRDPLDAVAGAADDRHQARHQQRPGLRHAEVGEADGGAGDHDQRRTRCGS